MSQERSSQSDDAVARACESHLVVECLPGVHFLRRPSAAEGLAIIV